jgi:hypothetical protein
VSSGSPRRRATGNLRLPVGRRWRETPDVVEGVARMIRAVGKRVAREDLDALQQLQDLDRAMADAWQAAISGLRSNYSDRALGDALGITRQAVEKRWPRQNREETR